jgi:hypothetical protein
MPITLPAVGNEPQADSTESKLDQKEAICFLDFKEDLLKLRTFGGELVTGEFSTEFDTSPDGSPVIVVKGEPYNSEEAEFFLESATEEELELLEEGGYDLQPWWG